MRLFSRKGPKPPDEPWEKIRPVVISVQTTPQRPEEDLSRTFHRLNVKGLAAVASAMVLAPALYFGLAFFQEGRLRRVALAEAAEAEKAGRIDQAVRVLDFFLRSWPEDVEGIEQMARLRTESARSLPEIKAAADAQDLLLRVDPMGPGRQDNRRKLVSLYVRWSEILRMATSGRKLSLDKTDNRSRAAVKIAEQIIAFGDDGAEAHRLLATALESLAGTGDSKALVDATVEYEKALRRDPGERIAAERLARLTFDRNADVAGADEVLAALLQARPTDVETRLIRYRFFSLTARYDKAKAELDEAIRLAPASDEVRLACAGDALQRRDTATARRHLETLSAEVQAGRRALLLRGFLDLSERHVDLAVDSWRGGLVESKGGDRDLSWRLAHTLLQLGRFNEAEPLVAQYRRLAGDDDAMGHFLQGLRNLQTGRPAAAIKELEEIRASLDRAWLPELSMALGRAYETLGDESRALIEYRLVAKASPRTVNAWRAIARQDRKGKPDDAARDLEEGLTHVPGDLSLLTELALVRLEQQLAKEETLRDWAKVEEIFDRAGDAGRSDPGLVKVRAEVLARSGQLDRAMALLRDAVAGPGRSRDELWLGLAAGLVKQGKPDEALATLAKAAEPGQAGDLAALRLSRANFLLQLGRGREARQVLGAPPEAMPPLERTALARGRVQLLQALGEREGAREACLEWARLAPVEPEPALALLDLAQQNNDDQAATIALELLRRLGGEDEPYALVGRALDLLLSNRTMADTRRARLEVAAELSQKLMTRAPKLPATRLVHGLVLEQNHRVEEAIVEYTAALDGNTRRVALGRLVQLYSKLKRFDDLAALKEKLGLASGIDQMAATMALQQGDKEAADRLTAHLLDGQSTDLRAHAVQAKLLRDLGKPQAAEDALKDMVEHARDRPDAWAALVAFQTDQARPADAQATLARAAAEYRGERPDLLIARLQWAAGNRDHAAKLYDDAIAKHPDDLPTYQAAAEFAEAAAMTDRLEAWGRQALQSSPCSAWAARMLAILLGRRGGLEPWTEAWKLVGPGGPGAGEAPGDRLLRASLLASCPDPARRVQAIPALASLVDDLPASGPIAARARVNLASALLEAGRLAEAAKPAAEATLESAEADSATLALAVEALARAGRPEEADQRLTRLAAIEPDSPRTAAARAWVFIARGKSREAGMTLEDAAVAAEKRPDGLALMSLYFNQLAMMRLDAPAERLARRIAGLSPKQGTILARWLASKGRHAEALDAALEAARAGAGELPIRLAIEFAAESTLAEKARAVADVVVAAHPDDIPIKLLGMGLANRQGRYDDSMLACRKAFDARPTDPDLRAALNDMAWIFCEELGRPNDALDAVERSIAASPIPTPSALDTRGVILTRLGQLDRAIADLQQAVADQPAPNRLLHLARAYKAAGKKGLHDATIERAKKAGIDPASLSPKERAEFQIAN